MSSILFTSEGSHELPKSATAWASRSLIGWPSQGLSYRGGFTSYLEVLTSETNFFSAELGLAQARLNELLALVAE